MPFWVNVQSAPTYSYYIHEGETEKEAQEGEGEYMGYIDGDQDDYDWLGPFDTEEEANEHIPCNADY